MSVHWIPYILLTEFIKKPVEMHIKPVILGVTICYCLVSYTYMDDFVGHEQFHFVWNNESPYSYITEDNVSGKP